MSKWMFIVLVLSIIRVLWIVVVASWINVYLNFIFESFDLHNLTLKSRIFLHVETIDAI